MPNDIRAGLPYDIPEGPKKEGPNQATDQLERQELGHPHPENTKSQGAGQAYSKDILSDKQTQGFITADDIFGLINLDLQFGKRDQDPGRGGFTQEIEDHMAQVRGKAGRAHYQPEIQKTLMGQETPKNQGGFSFKKGPGKDNQVAVLLE